MKNDYIEYLQSEIKDCMELYNNTYKRVDLIHVDFDIERLEMALKLKDWEFIELMIENKKSEKSKIEESLKGK